MKTSRWCKSILVINVLQKLKSQFSQEWNFSFPDPYIVFFPLCLELNIKQFIDTGCISSQTLEEASGPHLSLSTSPSWFSFVQSETLLSFIRSSIPCHG